MKGFLLGIIVFSAVFATGKLMYLSVFALLRLSAILAE